MEADRNQNLIQIAPNNQHPQGLIAAFQTVLEQKGLNITTIPERELEVTRSGVMLSRRPGDITDLFVAKSKITELSYGQFVVLNRKR